MYRDEEEIQAKSRFNRGLKQKKAKACRNKEVIERTRDEV